MTIVLVALGVVALGLSVATQRAAWVEGPRGFVEDLVQPGRAIAAAPFDMLDRVARGMRDRGRLARDNARLREENERLRAWFELAHTMRDKMERYEQLLSVNADPGVQVVAARAVAEIDGPFVRARILNAGRKQGVEPGHGALSERGLLGRIVSAGRRSSRILLLSDLNSRVPVMAERHDVRAILAGDNTPYPRLEFLPRGHGVVNGDRIVTSGDGGGLPRGLVVGEAFADERGAWRVRLFADDTPYDYVRIMQFDFPSAPENEPNEESPAAAPPGTTASAPGGAG